MRNVLRAAVITLSLSAPFCSPALALVVQPPQEVPQVEEAAPAPAALFLEKPMMREINDALRLNRKQRAFVAAGKLPASMGDKDLYVRLLDFRFDTLSLIGGKLVKATALEEIEEISDVAAAVIEVGMDPVLEQAFAELGLGGDDAPAYVGKLRCGAMEAGCDMTLPPAGFHDGLTGEAPVDEESPDGEIPADEMTSATPDELPAETHDERKSGFRLFGKSVKDMIPLPN